MLCCTIKEGETICIQQKRIISLNGKERIIFTYVQNKDDCQPKEKIINIEKKKRRICILQAENLCMTYYIHYGAQAKLITHLIKLNVVIKDV